MPADSSRLFSWLKSDTSPVAARRRPLQCERLEDRLTPSGSSYLPPSHFFVSPNMTAASSAAPLTVAMNYLNANAAQFGLTPGDLANSLVTDQYRDSNTGISHIYLRQTVNGLEVENANINVAVTAGGRVIAAGGGYVAGLAARLGGPVQPSLSAAQAVQRAATALGVGVPNGIGVLQSPVGIANSTIISAADVSLDPITAKLHYIPTADGSATLSWQLIVRTPDGNHWYDLSIADSGGAMIAQHDWSNDATYHVLANPTESPQDGVFELLVDPHDITASPFGWHDTDGVDGAEFTDTRGNNVDVHLDLDDNDIGDPDDPFFIGVATARPDGGIDLDFSGFTFDPTSDPSTAQNRAIAQLNLFYAINLSHDIHYKYGFDEAAGNFQVNNYGNGGIGGDAVEGDAQDGGGTDNANFATPPDGFAPRMQQYIWTYTPIFRDSSLDNSVIFHEFGHGVSNRLTGGPSNSNALDALQSGAMGEGWSEFYAIMMLQREGDIKLGGYGSSTFVVGEAQTDNGLQNFLYSFDMSKNPLTFDAFGTTGTTSYGVVRDTEVHVAGEIWTAALWDMNWLLIEKYGFDADLSTGWTPGFGGIENAGNKLAFALVNQAMKLQPANPTFIQARDAILAADVVLNGGEDQDEIWTAFARRGLGINATTADADATTVVVDFNIPPAVSITAVPVTVEGDSGTYGVTFTVALSKPTNRTVTVNYTTVDGTATAADGDYAPAFGTLTFAPGQTIKTFNVQIIGDVKFEADETFSVELSTPTKSYLVPRTSTATVVILNDDAAPPGGGGGGDGPEIPLQTLAAATVGGVVAEVRAIDPSNSGTRWAVRPFDAFQGAVTVAVGDIDGDGTGDVVVGAGAGANPRVVVLDGQNGAELNSFFAFSSGFAGGVTVAAGDVNGDGRADIIVGADTRGFSHVKVFDGVTLAEIRSFYAFRSDYEFGVRVAAGDVNGDGHADIFVSAGAGGTPGFRIFDGATGAILQDRMAFAPEFAGGIFIAAGDIDGDGLADAIIGTGTFGLPHVKVFSGATGAEISSFYVNEEFSPNAVPSIPFEAGISVASADLDGDGIDEILTGKGRGSRSILRSFRIAQRSTGGTAFTGLQPVGARNVFEGYFGGITIGG